MHQERHAGERDDPEEEAMRTAISLFAGVGGFDLALERNGVKVVAAVEIDKHARAILAKQFPSTTLFNDVMEVTGHELIAAGFQPNGGIITGGFPCQDLSVAGKRAGLAGARSGLFWEICRIADETQAEWLVLENVPGLLNSNGGRDMGTVVGALVELGYSVAWRVLDAQHFGVPQRRRRVFIVGRRAGDPASPAQVLFERESVRGYPASSNPEGQEAARDAGAGVEVASTLRSGGDGGVPSSRGENIVVEGPVLSNGGGRSGVFGQSGYGTYALGVKTLNASMVKRPEDSVVVREVQEGAECPR